MFTWIVEIIIQMLLQFLINLFLQGATDPTPHQDAFLAQVKGKWLLGPWRNKWAQSLYQQAADRYQKKQFLIDVTGEWSSSKAGSLATQLVKGLKP